MVPAMLLGILNPWPYELSAEAEFISRLRRALTSQGHESYVIDSNGKVISPSKTIVGDLLDASDALLVFDPRYVGFSPPCPIVSPVWVPPELLPLEQRLDFLKSMVKVDLFIGGYGSRSLQAAYNSHLAQINRTVGTLAPFCSSVPLEYAIAPRLFERRRLFYIGVNSERIAYSGGEMVTVPGRHDALFRLLDASEFADIFGPRRFGGIEPWHGFANYRGEIPNDGRSVLAAIADCGVALAISSAAHLKYGIVSNRIFESAAAGAVIISDDNAFVRENFGDSVLYVDTKDPATCFARICELMDRFSAEPRAALDLAQQSHRVFLERQSLDAYCGSLENALSNYARKRAGEKIALVIDALHDLDGLEEYLSEHNFDYVAFVGVAASKPPHTAIQQGSFETWDTFVAAAPAHGIDFFTGRLDAMKGGDCIRRMLECADACPAAGMILLSNPDLAGLGVTDPELHVLKLHISGLSEFWLFKVFGSLLASGRALFRVAAFAGGTSEVSNRYHEWLYRELMRAFTERRWESIAFTRGFHPSDEVKPYRALAVRETYEFLYSKACEISIQQEPSDLETAVILAKRNSTVDLEKRVAWLERKIARRRPLRALKRGFARLLKQVRKWL